MVEPVNHLGSMSASKIIQVKFSPTTDIYFKFLSVRSFRIIQFSEYDRYNKLNNKKIRLIMSSNYNVLRRKFVATYFTRNNFVIVI